MNAVRFFATYPAGVGGADQLLALGAIEQKRLADMATALSDDDSSPLASHAENYADAYAPNAVLGVGLRHLRTDCRT